MISLVVRIQIVKVSALLIASSLFPHRTEAQCELGKLSPGTNEPFNFFGSDVAISGNTIAVGAIGDSDAAPNSGAVYVFRRQGTVWHLEQKLTSSDAGPDAALGQSVALDGDVLLAGAPHFTDSLICHGGEGQAFIFRRNNVGVWSQEAHLKSDDFRYSAWMGFGLAIKGDVAAVGAPANRNCGSVEPVVHLYRHYVNSFLCINDSECEALGLGVCATGVCSGSGWALEQTVFPVLSTDSIGAPVALDNGTLITGSAGTPCLAGAGCGSVYVYEYDGEQWVVQPRLFPPDAAAGDSFGSALAISNSTLAVGKYGDDEKGISAGAVYIFERTMTGWSLPIKLFATDMIAGGHFGSKVAISGDVLVVAASGYVAPDFSRGKFYVFRRMGSSWIEEAQLLPEAGHPFVFNGSLGLDGDTMATSEPVRIFDISDPPLPDCNANGIHDTCDEADFNSDGTTTMLDFAALGDCLTGPVPGIDLTAPCCFFDSDAGMNVDLRDFAVFQCLFGLP